MGFVHSDQEEHQRVRDEGSVFPECLDGFFPPSEIVSNDLKLPMTSPAVMVASTPDKPKCPQGETSHRRRRS